MFARNKTIESKGSRQSTPKKNKQLKNNKWDYQTPQPSHKHSQLDLSRTLLDSAFKNHPQACLCKDCICGRHLCNLTSQSPTLTLSTTYKRDYPSRNPYKHKAMSRPASARVPQTPMLSLTSTYLQDYHEPAGDPLQRPKPKDLIGCKGGPTGQMTTYLREYPGHKGKNQYVPMNPELFRGGMKFDANSSYSKEFARQNGKSADKARPPDQFSMAGSWFGGSTYKDKFQDPKNHLSKGKSNYLSQSFCSQNEGPANFKNTSSHFRTTYRTQFLGVTQPVCPAVTKIQQLQEEISHAKSFFKQNSHFKGMDSRYSSLAKNGNQF